MNRFSQAEVPLIILGLASLKATGRSTDSKADTKRLRHEWDSIPQMANQH